MNCHINVFPRKQGSLASGWHVTDVSACPLSDQSSYSKMTRVMKEGSQAMMILALPLVIHITYVLPV